MDKNNLQTMLDEYGLLSCSFSYDELPAPLKHTFENNTGTEFNGSFLTLIANGGNRFWTSMQSTEYAIGHQTDLNFNENPVDEFSRFIANKLLSTCSTQANKLILYPGNYQVPLIELGKLAGWSMPSTLGLGLHPEYGPWFAYRALVKTSEPVQQLSQTKVSEESPCLTCTAAPCTQACPAGAVSVSEPFNIMACATHRTTPQSICKDECHARRACPVGIEFQYTKQQLNYHMRFSLLAMRNWIHDQIHDH